MAGCFLRRQYATNFPESYFLLGKKVCEPPPNRRGQDRHAGKSHAGPDASSKGVHLLFSAETFPGTTLCWVPHTKMDV